MTDKILLVIQGKPIVATHNLSISESAFKEKAKANITDEDDLNPFSLPRERFLGRFHGYHQKEFSIKLKSSFFRKYSGNQLIWIYGKIEPLSETSIRLHLRYHRTAFAKYLIWVSSAIIGSVLLWTIIQTLKYHALIEYLPVMGFLMIFHLLFIFMNVASVNGEIKYFERYFLGNIPEV